MVTRASLDKARVAALECTAGLQRIAMPLMDLAFVLSPTISAVEFEEAISELSKPGGECGLTSVARELEDAVDRWQSVWGDDLRDCLLLAAPADWGPYSVAGWSHSTAHEAAGRGLRSTASAIRQVCDWEAIGLMQDDERRRIVVALTARMATFDVAILRAAIDGEWRRAVQAIESKNDDSTWPTVTKAAQEQGVSKDVISKAANSGKIRTNGKTGHGRRIDPSSLVEWSLSRIQVSE